MNNSLSPASLKINRNIAIWLLICCTAIFAMTVLGGVTRLTGSGLSMVQWQPIIGALPPLNEAEWQQTFELYKQSPEFVYKNNTMDLDGFKGIFWFEYAHRLLGRTIGVIFLLPLLYFAFRGQISKPLQPQLVTIFLLGGLQGALGWYMVKSGLVDDPHVSQYRLTAHLAMAFFIYTLIFWVALNLFFPKRTLASSHSVAMQRFSLVAAIIVFTTVLSGGFVAGLKAGFIYNTFPLMGDSFIPKEIFALDPLWRNFFENMTTVQFNHRVLASCTFVFICAFWIASRKAQLSFRARLGVNLLLAAALLQVTLGISTLLLAVPVSLGAAHQGGALLLFTVAVFTLHAIKRP